MIGLAFLIGQVTNLAFSWTFILMGLGLAFLARTLIDKQKGSSVFTGVLLLLLGLAFFGDDMGWEMLGVWDAWPFIPGIVGVAFLAEYIFTTPKKQGLLLTSAILIAVGALFVMAESRYMDWYTVGQILEWWPIILLIIGVWFIVRKPGKAAD